MRSRRKVKEEIDTEDRIPGMMQSNSIKEDLPAIFLLLLLYFLQGIPMGLSASLDLSMQEGGRLSFEEQGIYSSCSWPYSLKMLWAPLVDSLFFKRFGRRKTWVVPFQFFIGIILLLSADDIPVLLGENSLEKPKVYQLTGIFFTFFFLCATQDIAVDGWALEMLSKRNVGWASTCNSIGLTIGYTVSFQGFMALRSFGMIDMAQFMKFSGWAFLFTTMLVAIFKKEEMNEDSPESIRGAYLKAWQVCKLKPVKTLIFALVTRSVAFAVTDTLTTRKLLGMGMKKEMVATVATILIPISIILPGIIGQYTNEKPLSIFVKAYVPKIILSLCGVLVVYYCPQNLSTETPLWFSLAILILSILASIFSTAQFVSLMAFFAKVSDPIVGGSYMTTLNTATNLGSKWPNTLVLFAVNKVAIQTCTTPDNCEILLDGYYVLALISLLAGILWINYFAGKFHQLELLKADAWLVSKDL